MTLFRKKSFKMLMALLLISAFIIPQLGCSSNGQKASSNAGISKTGYYLNTTCQLAVYGIDPESELGAELAQMDEEEQEVRVLQLITDAFLLCDKYEKVFSKTIESSEISQINDAAGAAVEVSDVTVDVLKKGLYYGELSGGVFDITIGKATQLWDFHDVDENHESESELPDEDDLAEAVKHVDYEKISIDGNTVTVADPEMEIDLGGIAKGYISDLVADYLVDNGVTGAVVNLGGNIVTVGGKTPELLSAETEDIVVGIGDPFSETGELMALYPCQNKVVVTSGTYERYLIKDGEKYHHVLDVNTGYPVDTDVISVTIIAERGSGADADGLSTSCLALGMEKGMELIKGIDGVEAVFIDVDGNVEMTSEELGIQVQ